MIRRFIDWIKLQKMNNDRMKMRKAVAVIRLIEEKVGELTVEEQMKIIIEFTA